MRLYDGVGSDFFEGEERIREGGAFSQCFFGQTAAIISFGGEALHGPLEGRGSGRG
jgi:hypothetical protein